MSTIVQTNLNLLRDELESIASDLLVASSKSGGDLSVVEQALGSALGRARAAMARASLETASSSMEKAYCCPDCEQRLTYWGCYDRQIITCAGGARVRVRRYRCLGCGKEIAPLLVRNGLEQTSYTFGARQTIAEEAAEASFGRASERLGRLSVDISAASVERISDEVSILREQEEEAVRGYLMLHGHDLNLLLHDTRAWERIDEGAWLVLSVDGAMVRSTIAGEGGLEWFEVRAGALTLSTEGAPKVRVAGMTDPDRLFETLLSQARQLGPKRKIAFVADGGVWIWARVTQYFKSATQILDIYHAGEHVASAARALWGDDDPTTKLWCKTARSMLLAPNGARSVIRCLVEGLRQCQVADRQQLTRELRYLLNHRHRMRYWHYQQQGLPVGSGVMESTIKQTSTQRLCQAGMMWTKSGADKMMRLRAACASKSLHLTIERQARICRNRLEQYQLAA